MGEIGYAEDADEKLRGSAKHVDSIDDFRHCKGRNRLNVLAGKVMKTMKRFSTDHHHWQSASRLKACLSTREWTQMLFTHRYGLPNIQSFRKSGRCVGRRRCALQLKPIQPALEQFRIHRRDLVATKPAEVTGSARNHSNSP
jgi:hypothetical protein